MMKNHGSHSHKLYKFGRFIQKSVIFSLFPIGTLSKTAVLFRNRTKIFRLLQRAEYVAQLLMENEVRFAVEGRLVAVDQHQAAAPVVADHPGSRPDSQRGPGHDQQIRPGNRHSGPAHHVLIQALLIEHHVRLHHAAAVAARHALAVLDKFGGEALMAARAVVAQHGAVQLENVLLPAF